MKISIKTRHKSIPSGIEFDLPSFCVLTGKNGSGKTHLLEALVNQDVSNVSDGEQTLRKISLIEFSGLSMRYEERFNHVEHTNHTKSWWSQIQNLQKQVVRNREYEANFSDDISKFNGLLEEHTFQVLSKLIERASKSLCQLTEDDVYYYLNIDQAKNGRGSIFSSQIAMIFKTYHIRYMRNEFRIFLNEKSGTSYSTYSDEEFKALFGPKPWDLINEIFVKSGMPYVALSPEVDDGESSYELRLIDSSTGANISANELSTGEKVLMSLAFAIYNTKGAFEKPDLLVLDEPDAPLHPQYSKLLIDTLVDVIVKSSGVRVIMTTHSPTTVAMCPSNSLFEMDRESKVPHMISVSKGIEVLTSGIPHLKVSLENRRQIFVESKYDVKYFTSLFEIVQRNNPLSYQAVFLEPHSGTSNCTDVESIVMRLHQAGSDLVRGIIDWDGCKVDNGPVFVLGSGRRYAIENYILDPIYVVLSLIRASKKKWSDYGASNLETYLDATKLNNAQAQMVVNSFLLSLGFTTANHISCSLQNGWSIQLPSEFLNLRGHDWEVMLFDQIPELKAVAKGNSESALKLGLLQVIAEYPQFISTDIHETFVKLA